MVWEVVACDISWEAEISVNSRISLSTEQVLGHSGLHTETLPGETLSEEGLNGKTKEDAH